MNKDNLCKYYSSMLMYKKLLFNDEITNDEYNKIESFLADKYCIKINHIIRSNDLISSSFRVIYGNAKKEEKSNDNK